MPASLSSNAVLMRPSLDSPSGIGCSGRSSHAWKCSCRWVLSVSPDASDCIETDKVPCWSCKRELSKLPKPSFRPNVLRIRNMLATGSFAIQ